jgi:hypothetical protein
MYEKCLVVTTRLLRSLLLRPGGFFGGFTTLQPPGAAAPALITIEAKALECRTEHKQFKLWVGENRRLFMAEA